MFKELGAMASLMKQAQQMQGRMSEIQEGLKSVRVEGVSGGGMVRVEANGQQQIVACHIEPAVFSDQEMLEELVVAAVNQALEKSREAMSAEMGKLTGNIPGLGDALAKFGIGGGQ